MSVKDSTASGAWASPSALAYVADVSIGAVSMHEAHDSTGSGAFCIGATQQPAVCTQVAAHAAMTTTAACWMSMQVVCWTPDEHASCLSDALASLAEEPHLVEAFLHGVFYFARPEVSEPAKTHRQDTDFQLPMAKNVFLSFCFQPALAAGEIDR